MHPAAECGKLLNLFKKIIDRYNEIANSYQPRSLSERRVQFVGDAAVYRFFNLPDGGLAELR